MRHKIFSSFKTMFANCRTQRTLEATCASLQQTEPCFFASIFFPSGLADVAQRLGPNRKISGCKMKLSTWHCGHIQCSKTTSKQTQTNHDTTTGDPQIPQPDLRFVKQKANQTQQKQKKGQEPNNNTHNQCGNAASTVGRDTHFFFGRCPLPFGGSPLEAYSQTSGESNHHRQSVSDTRVPRYQLSYEDT